MATKPPIPLAKRALDMLVCGLAMIVLGPVMLLAAIAIKLSSRGPVFYQAKRAGYKGQPFYELKFRTHARSVPTSPAPSPPKKIRGCFRPAPFCACSKSMSCLRS